MDTKLKAEQLLARGICRHLKQYNFACLEEFVPVKGSRVDIIAVGPKGEIWIIECKSSAADYNRDKKMGKVFNLLRSVFLGSSKRLSNQYTPF